MQNLPQPWVLNKTAFRKFVVPKDVIEVTIFQDHSSKDFATLLGHSVYLAVARSACYGFICLTYSLLQTDNPKRERFNNSLRFT